jgi:hypothetical protein
MATQDATDVGANFMLDALGKTVTPAADTIWVGLSSTTPTKTGAPGHNITAPTGDYQRAPTTFGVAAARKRTNTNVANFVNGGGPANANQGNFTHATFHSASTGGTCYAFTQLSQTLVWTGGLPVTMAVGDVSLEFESV